jgi:hypothetical protein
VVADRATEAAGSARADLEWLRVMTLAQLEHLNLRVPGELLTGVS